MFSCWPSTIYREVASCVHCLVAVLSGGRESKITSATITAVVLEVILTTITVITWTIDVPDELFLARVFLSPPPTTVRGTPHTG